MMKYKYLKEWKEPKFKHDKPIMFDSETFVPRDSKSRAKTLAFYGETRLIQLGQGKRVYVYDVMDNPKLLKKIKKYIKGKHIVVQYAVYDMHCPMTNYMDLQPSYVEDLIYISRHAYPELESHSLGSVLAHTGLEVKGEEGQSDWGVETLTDEQIYYAAYDVYAMSQLLKLKSMKKARKMFTCKLDQDNLNYALSYANNGFPVCQSKLEETKETKRAEIEVLEEELPSTLNVNSPKQVCELLGTESGNVETLSTLYLSEGNEVAGNILKLRKAKKQLSTLEKKWSFDRIYGKFNPSGAKTGRWTCSGKNALSPQWQNLQQLDRTMKDVFGFEEDNDMYLVDADFSALEIFSMIATFNDFDMAKVILDGNDLHTETAGLVELKGRDAKFKRQVAKGLNFSVGYGGGAETVQTFIKTYAQEMLPLTIVTMLKDKWLKKYPATHAFHKKVGEQFKRNPHYVVVHDILGRPIRAKSYNEAINTPCQALGAEQTKIALCFLFEKYPNAKLVNTVHDSITLEVKGFKEAKKMAKYLKRCMDESWLMVRPYASGAAQELVMNNEAEVTKLYGGEALWKTK